MPALDDPLRSRGGEDEGVVVGVHSAGYVVVSAWRILTLAVALSTAAIQNSTPLRFLYNREAVVSLVFPITEARARRGCYPGPVPEAPNT